MGAIAATLGAMLALSGCAGRHDEAEELMDRTQIALLTSAQDAAKFAPERFQTVQSQVADLKSAFDRKQYDDVLARGPAVLAAAQALAADAAADKQAAHQALVADWTQLADTLPDRLMRIGMAVEAPAARGHALRMDPAEAKRELHDANSLWSKARSAFASGNLDEAVHTAKDAAAQVDALAPRVGL
jgi:putative NADH-flavin reductase